MRWPLSQDYNEAIQTPAQCFADSELRQGEVVTNDLGLPMPCSGNFADVYAVVAGQRKWAVKCFTRQIARLRERYAEISKYLPQVQLPFMVDFQFLEQGIRVRGQWFPVLKMQWVEGMPLNQFVKAHLDKPQMLEKLSNIWPRLAARLHEANLAHGDLQHGNILLVEEREGKLAVKLVDYDGMCVPSLQHLQATEVGHPAFQHPQRLREATYNLQIDRFSHLVIYTALRSLVIGGRKLWDRYDDGDNLLFTKNDFALPQQSAVFQSLRNLNNPEVVRLADALAEAARGPVNRVPQLPDVVQASSPPTSGASNSAPVPVAVPVGVPMGKPALPKAIPTVPTSPPLPKTFRGRKSRSKRRTVAAILVVGLALGAAIIIGLPPPPSPPTETDHAQPPTELTGSLVLFIEPEQSQVAVDGKVMVHASAKDVKLELSNTRHELKVTREGFKPHVQSILVIPGKTETIKIRLERSTETGTLVLEIEPEQSEVVFDGKVVSGASPKELRIEVTREKHELKVSKSGFNEHKEMLDFTGLAVKRLKVRLEPVGATTPKQPNAIEYTFKDANSFDDFQFVGRFKTRPNYGIEFLKGELGQPVSGAYSKAQYTYPIAVEYEVLCLQDGLYDIWPALFHKVGIHWGTFFNTRTTAWVGKESFPVPHKKIVANQVYLVKIEIDGKRKLSIAIDGKEVFQTTVDENIELKGPVCAYGGIGHVVYKRIKVTGKKLD